MKTIDVALLRVKVVAIMDEIKSCSRLIGGADEAISLMAKTIRIMERMSLRRRRTRYLLETPGLQVSLTRKLGPGYRIIRNVKTRINYLFLRFMMVQVCIPYSTGEVTRGLNNSRRSAEGSAGSGSAGDQLESSDLG